MSKNKNNFEEDFENHEEEINIRQILEQYLYYWKWFVLGVIVSLIFAFIYI